MAIIGGIPHFQTYPCGNPVVFVVFCEALVLEWEPPSDNGGADLVAYRLWLRPVFQENVLRSFVFLCDSFILMYPCQVPVMTIIISSWRAIYFCFFRRSFFLGVLVLCFPASDFLLLCFSASLIFCFSAFLFLCFPCLSAFVLLCLSTSTILLFPSSVFLLLYFMLLCFFASCLYRLFVFHFLLLYSFLFAS